jgi:hypothetical protein
VEAVWERVWGGVLLGSERFLEKMQAYLKGNDQEQTVLGQLHGRPTLAAAIAAVGTKQAYRKDAAGERSAAACGGMGLALAEACRLC